MRQNCMRLVILPVLCALRSRIDEGNGTRLQSQPGQTVPLRPEQDRRALRAQACGVLAQAQPYAGVVLHNLASSGHGGSGRGLSIRADVPATELRRLARREPDRAASTRMSAIAHALEGMSRAEAARLAGMERQALRDAVVRYNAEGLDGLHDRPRPDPKPRLDNSRMAELRKLVLNGPNIEWTGLSAWTLGELCAEIERRWKVSYHVAHMSKLMRKLKLSRQKAWPSHPKADPAARGSWSKRGCKANLAPSRRRIRAAA